MIELAKLQEQQKNQRGWKNLEIQSLNQLIKRVSGNFEQITEEKFAATEAFGGLPSSETKNATSTQPAVENARPTIDNIPNPSHEEYKKI